MPYTEKKEREKLNAAMTAYRVFLWLSIASFVSLMYSFYIWNVVAEMFMVVGFAWHYLQLRGNYLKDPLAYLSRPKIIAALFSVGIFLHFVVLIFSYARKMGIMYESTIEAWSGGETNTFSMIPTFYGEVWTLILLLHVVASIVSIVMFVLFSQFLAIHNALEVSGQTTALADSDPLGIADELRRLKTPRSNH